MEINISFHCFAKYKKYNDTMKMKRKEIIELIRKEFIRVYSHWKIQFSYNFNHKVRLWKETFVYDTTKELNYSLITYYVSDKCSRQEYKVAQKKKAIKLKKESYKWRTKNTLKKKYFTNNKNND